MAPDMWSTLFRKIQIKMLLAAAEKRFRHKLRKQMRRAQDANTILVSSNSSDDASEKDEDSVVASNSDDERGSQNSSDDDGKPEPAKKVRAAAFAPRGRAMPKKAGRRTVPPVASAQSTSSGRRSLVALAPAPSVSAEDIAAGKAHIDTLKSSSIASWRVTRQA